jgi:hypothetical protein
VLASVQRLKKLLAKVDDELIFNLITDEPFMCEGTCAYCRSTEHDEASCKKLEDEMATYLVKAGAEVAMGIPDITNPLAVGLWGAAAVCTGGLSTIFMAAGMANKAKGLNKLLHSEKKEQAKHLIKTKTKLGIIHVFDKTFLDGPYPKQIKSTNEKLLREKISMFEKALK